MSSSHAAAGGGAAEAAIEVLEDEQQEEEEEVEFVYDDEDGADEVIEVKRAPRHRNACALDHKACGHACGGILEESGAEGSMCLPCLRPECAPARGADKNFHLLANGWLPHIVRQAARTNVAVERDIFYARSGRYEAVVRHVSK